MPDGTEEAFARLPETMARAEAVAGRIDRAVVDLAEAVMLDGEQGRIFEAIVTDLDQRGARIQLKDLPVVARVPAHRVGPGDAVRVRLTEADPVEGRIAFARVG